MDYICSLCSEPADLKCQRCTQPYCSRECQINDWYQHKTICIPMPSLIKANNSSRKDSNEHQIIDIVSEKRESKMASKSNGSNVLLDSLIESVKKFDTKQTSQQVATAPLRFPKIKIENDLFVTDSKRESGMKTSDSSKPFEKDDKIKSEVIMDNKRDRKPEQFEKNEKSEIVSTEKRPVPTEVDATVEENNKIQPNLQTRAIRRPILQQMKSDDENKMEPWMKPFPIDDEGLIPVIVQYADETPTRSAWVMHSKYEEDCTRMLVEINKNISDAKYLKINEAKVNELVIVEFDSVYYRAVIKSQMNATGCYSVRLIDYGNEISVPLDVIKSVTPQMRNTNAFAFEIILKVARKMEIGEVLDIQVKSMSKDNVATVIVKGENDYPSMEDLEIIPIPVGVKAHLYTLDYSNARQGYISACVYDPKKIEQMEKQGENVSEYCSKTKEPYCPRIDELCIALYEDGQWYRAVALKFFEPNVYSIMFIDYGNISSVNSSNIRKMPNELMYPCLMNICTIKGAPRNLTLDDAKKIASYFHENTDFMIKSAEKGKNSFIIDVPGIEW